MRFLRFVPRFPALRVRHKLSLSLLALGSALLASSAATFYVSKAQREDLAAVNAGIETIQTKFIPLGSAVRDLQLDVIQVQQNLNDAALTKDPQSYKDAANFAQDVTKQITVIKEIMKDINQPALKNHHAKFIKAMALLQPQFESYYKQGLEMANAYRDKGPEAGKAAMEDFDKSVYNIGLQLDNLLVAQGRMIRQFSRESGEQAQAAATAAGDLTRLTEGLFGFGLVVALAAAIYVRRGVTAPLGRIILALGQARNGSGDMDLRDANRRDELGDLARALQTLRDVQQETMRLEAEALQMRQAGEIEREAAEAAKARAAADVIHCVQRLQMALGRLAEGDLTARVEDAFAEDYESLRIDFNVALEKLAGAMQSVDSAVANVRNGAAEIMAASNDLADRTLKQAASLQQATSRIVDVAGAVRQNSTCADGALQMVGGARKSTARGESAAKAAVDAMKRIAGSSSRIGQIIGVIDEIAFQTNLLALNAGVEAARAGDAGRGFAVVASEVRALALRTAEAAKEIKALIASSTSEVGEGVSLVGRTGEALADIEKQVLEISEAVSLIAANARQEAGALEELTAMARDLDQSVHNNASMSEETTTACSSLYKQSDELAELMSNFQAVAPEERELRMAA